MNPKPTKADQDKLDAVICTLCGYLWWLFGARHSTVVGDVATGYIVAPTNPVLTAELTASAARMGVLIAAR